MSEYIRVDSANAVKIDGVVLPGILQGIEVTGELRLENQAQDGGSGSRKLIRGFADDGVRLEVRLLGDVDKQLRQITDLFKVDSPKGRRVVNRHLDARKIKKLIFKGLTSRDSGPDTIDLTLTFSEYDAEIRQLEQKDASASGAAGGGSSGGAGSGAGSSGSGTGGAAGSGGSGSGAGGAGRATGAGGPNSSVSDPNTRSAGSGVAGGAGASPSSTAASGGRSALVDGYGAGAQAAARLLGR